MDNRRRGAKQKEDERGKPTVSGSKRKRGCKSKKTNHEIISTDSETASGCRRRKGKVLAETDSSGSSCEEHEHSGEDEASSEYTSDGSMKPIKKRNDEGRRRSRKKEHDDRQHKLVDEASSDCNSDGSADARKKTARNAKARKKRIDDRKHRGVDEAASDESPRVVKKKKIDYVANGMVDRRKKKSEDVEEPSKGATCYRCHLPTTIKELKRLKYEEIHLRELKKTPFWLLFNALYKTDAAKLKKRCKKYEDDITQIIGAYEETSEKFIVGGRYVSLTDTDVELILGITGGGEPISLKRLSDKYPPWVKRCFAIEIDRLKRKFILYKSTILDKITTLLKEKDGCSALDVARLTHCYLLAALIAPNKNASMAPQYAFYLEKFSEICDYNWCGFVISVLRKQMTTGKSNRVGGCTILLPFWLCEHTYLVKPVSEYAFPRFLRWDLKDLNKKLSRERKSIPKLPSKYVNREELQHTPFEQETLSSLMRYWAKEGKSTQNDDVSDDEVQETTDDLMEDGSRACTAENTRTLDDDRGTLEDDECITATFTIATPPDKTPREDECLHDSCGFHGDARTGSPKLLVCRDIEDADTVSRGRVELTQENLGVLDDSHREREMNSEGPMSAGEKYQTVEKTKPSNEHRHSTKLFDDSEKGPVSEFGSLSMPSFALGSAQNEGNLDASLDVRLQKDIDCAIEYGMTGTSIMRIQKELEECMVKVQDRDALLLKKEMLVEERSSLLLHKERLVQERDSLLLSKNKLAEERDLLLLGKDKLGEIEKELEGCRIKLDEQGLLLLEKDKTISELHNNMEYMREQVDVTVKHLAEKDQIINDLQVEVSKYRDARKIEVTDRMREYVYTKWEAAKTAVVSSYETALKRLGDEVLALRAENEGLKMRINCPFATQVVEDPNTLARLDALAELHQEKERNDVLKQTCANLVGKLDLLAEVEDFTGVVGSDDKTPCGKGKGKNVPVTSNTVVRNVKDSTAKDDRHKKVLSPGPNTNEILELDGDFATEAVQLEEPAVFRWDRKFYAVRKSSEHIKGYLRELFDEHGIAHVVWSGTPDYNRVMIMDIFAILHEERLSSPVIDAWANLVRVVSMEKLGTCGAKVFTSQCWDLISNPQNFSSGTLDTFVHFVLDKVEYEDVLLFPMLAKGTKRTGDHWTLLTLDLGKGEWLFLNPRRPRNSDGHLSASFVVIEFVERELRERFRSSKPDHVLVKGPLKKPTSGLYLQQKTGTLDCGVVVCSHIENFILKREIATGDWKTKDAGEYRRRMVEWFLEPIEITLE